MNEQFIIKSQEFDAENIINDGNKFLIGNGYLGYRGTLNEYKKDCKPACNLPFLYDRNGDKWREPVNAPNALYSCIIADGKELNPLNIMPLRHDVALDISHGQYSRSSVFYVNDTTVSLDVQRFASFDEPHLLCEKIIIKSDNNIKIEFKAGIDLDVWDINGPHFKTEEKKIEDDKVIVFCKTLENNLPLAVVLSLEVNQSDNFTSKITDIDSYIGRTFSISLNPQKPFIITKYAAIVHSEINAGQKAYDINDNAKKQGYLALSEANKKVWKQKWADCDVEIFGDCRAQKALRYSIYHLLIIAPYQMGHSVSARGISGQTYKGAVFWDSEIFLLPFYTNTDLDIAKSLIRYRINTLDGARKKALDYGYLGAFYAWESQEDGIDACSDYNVTDVFTNRPLRTYFKDKQIHISADIAYAIWNYYLKTGDDSVLISGGAEVIFECARFYYSYAYYNLRLDRFELLDVIGPDEYHERVNNNAYTNYMAKKTLEYAIQCREFLSMHYKKYLINLEMKINLKKDWQNIKKVYQKLYVPKGNGLIEQFDGYFGLEDASIEKLKTRLIKPNEYWGGAHGIASDTQVIKQADVVVLLNLLSDEFDYDTKLKNLEFYEPRTEHGSSLSMCMHALLFCDCDMPDKAYPYFLRSAEIDINGNSKQFAGNIYIGGTHPAAAGGAYMSVVYGFCGLKTNKGKISIRPMLPSSWERVAFCLKLCGKKYKIIVEKNDYVIQAIT
ncbi:MAG TPA: glycosyl hydrolase family 65 protein [Clostridia bacterium]